MTEEEIVELLWHMPEEVWDRMVPLDGFPKSLEGTNRLFVFRDDDGQSWWVAVNLHDSGEVFPGYFGLLNTEGIRELRRQVEGGQQKIEGDP